MMRTALVALTVITIIGGVLAMRAHLGGRGQDGPNLQTDALYLEELRASVALQPDEVPGFNKARNSNVVPLGGKIFAQRLASPFAEHSPLHAKLQGVETIYFLQSLRRDGNGRAGRDPSFLEVTLMIYPGRDLAHDAGILTTESQTAPPGEPGMPEGSFTGLPVGEKSWATAPKSAEFSPGAKDANLVVWDNSIVIRVTISYSPVDPRARTMLFASIEDTDLEWAEYAVRLLLARTHYFLLSSGKSLTTVPVMVRDNRLEVKQTPEGVLLVPLKAMARALGGQVQENAGIYWLNAGGKWWTLPLGSRTILAGKQPVQQPPSNRMGAYRVMEPPEGSVNLRIPVLTWENEIWVDAEALGRIIGYPIQP
ncbi:MAG: hypothetical protein HPY54_03355 [Chthonomonadetes bacterium]|nr:hypothetical protein [Chthonomonadetes bacterium]